MSLKEVLQVHFIQQYVITFQLGFVKSTNGMLIVDLPLVMN